MTPIENLAEKILASGMSAQDACWELRFALTNAALRQTNGNNSHAAKLLGEHRNTLTRTKNLMREKKKPIFRRPYDKKPNAVFHPKDKTFSIGVHA